MKAIKAKLDTLLVLEGEPYEEVRYDPLNWPKDENGGDLDINLCYWNDIIVVAKSEEMLADELKTKIFEDIDDAFENILANGKFFSNSIELEVDCRRSASKNDLQNVTGLISSMKRNLASTTNYKGLSATKMGVSLEALQNLVYEMEDYGLALYNKKFSLEAQAFACVTRSALYTLLKSLTTEFQNVWADH
jgi:hypothetical protein